MMRSEPQFVVAESTLTDRYQVTVPAPVRKALGLEKRDKIAYSVNDDGTVLLSRVEAVVQASSDPVIEKFLEFLDKEIAAHPERLQPLTAEWANQIQELVADVDAGDPNQPLSGDDD
mgnify:CR=1 FL=1